MRSRRTACWLIGALAVIACRGVMAEDTLKLAIGQRGNWENAAPELEVRDQFFPKENLRLDRLSGLDEAMADAVSLKFMAAPLTKPQQGELFKYYARGAK